MEQLEQIAYIKFDHCIISCEIINSGMPNQSYYKHIDLELCEYIYLNKLKIIDITQIGTNKKFKRINSGKNKLYINKIIENRTYYLSRNVAFYKNFISNKQYMLYKEGYSGLYKEYHTHGFLKLEYYHNNGIIDGEYKEYDSCSNLLIYAKYINNLRQIYIQYKKSNEIDTKIVLDMDSNIIEYKMSEFYFTGFNIYDYKYDFNSQKYICIFIFKPMHPEYEKSIKRIFEISGDLRKLDEIKSAKHTGHFQQFENDILRIETDDEHFISFYENGDKFVLKKKYYGKANYSIRYCENGKIFSEKIVDCDGITIYKL